MIEKIRIIELAHQFMEGKKIFLTDVRIKPVNRISVMIDGDEPVGIDDCVSVSRFIEKNLDRETEDFELTVTSAGIDEPLKFARQYKKNIGRTLAIDLADNQHVEGRLTDAGDESVTIEKVIIEKINHKNVKKTDVRTISYSEIQKAVVMISFK